jgi:hypothetical protein
MPVARLGNVQNEIATCNSELHIRPPALAELSVLIQHGLHHAYSPVSGHIAFTPTVQAKLARAAVRSQRPDRDAYPDAELKDTTAASGATVNLGGTNHAEVTPGSRGRRRRTAGTIGGGKA